MNKGDEEFYQLTLGGEAGDAPAIGERLGRAVSETEVVAQIDTIIEYYRSIRQPDETFIACVKRVGVTPFKEAVNATNR